MRRFKRKFQNFQKQQILYINQFSKPFKAKYIINVYEKILL